MGRIWHLGNGGFLSGKLFQAPLRAPKTHAVNQRALKHLRTMFEYTELAALTADDIETYLRQRLNQRVMVKTKDGFVQKGVYKATTVHQELRVLRRLLNVAMRKKLCANPCPTHN